MVFSASVLGCFVCMLLLHGPLLSLGSSNQNVSITPLPQNQYNANSSAHNVSSNSDLQQLLSRFGNVPSLSDMFQQPIGSVGNVSSSTSLLACPVLQQILQSSPAAGLLDSPIVQQVLGMLGDGGPLNYLTVLKNLSSDCQNDVRLLLEAISKREGWALKFLDAMGKPPSGITDGHLRWLGSYDQCVDAKTLNNGTELRGQYCLADIPLTGILPSMPGSPAQITIGLCVPDTCQIDRLGLPVLCDNKKESFVNDQSAVIITAVVSALGTIILFATMYDVIRQHVTKKPKLSQVNEMDLVARPRDQHMNGFTNPPSKSVTTVENPPSDKNDTELEQCEKGEPGFMAQPSEEHKNGSINSPSYTETTLDTPPSTKKDAKLEQCDKGEPGIAGKLLLSFSIYTNGRKLLSTQQTPDSLTAVNGIRFLSMSWVILGHTLSFAYYFQANAVPFIVKAYKEWTFMAISNATVSVDTFFALSGLLVAYLSLPVIQSVGFKKFNWKMYYFHRIWRLTPPYMLFLFLYSIINPYIGNGPFWFASSHRDWDTCKETWWTNLLYVNNLVHTDKMCMGWSWYLANDMQFYVLSPLILIPFCMSPVAGGIASLIFLITTTVVPGVISAQKHYSALFPDITGNPVMMEYFDKVYIKPYCRMGPYLVGLFTGYLLYRTKRKVNIPTVINLLLWLVATSMNIAVLYGLYNPDNKHVLSEPEAAAYTALFRTAWGVGVCWVVFACATGNGGPINTLLSWSPFVPLSRLTYCAYLVHPVIIVYFYSIRRTTLYFAYPEMICTFLGYLVIAYLVAFVISLAFESPMMGLEKVIFKKGKK